MKSRLLTLTCVLTASALLPQAYSSNACYQALEDHHWSGRALLDGTPVEVQSWRFQHDMSMMFVTDSQDSTTIAVPIQVTCKSATRFQLTYSSNGASQPSMLDLSGALTNNQGQSQLIMYGTKKDYTSDKTLDAWVALKDG